MQDPGDRQPQRVPGAGHLGLGGYLSYLLRLWLVSSEGELTWRASLQAPGTREAVGFAGLEELLRFLRQAMQDQEEVGDRTCDAGRKERT